MLFRSFTFFLVAFIYSLLFWGCFHPKSQSSNPFLGQSPLSIQKSNQNFVSKSQNQPKLAATGPNQADLIDNEIDDEPEEEPLTLPKDLELQISSANLKLLSPGSLMVFDWPVDEARLSRGYYIKPPPSRKKRKRPHLGLDLANRRGTSIYASHEGRVIYVGSGFRGYGKMIMIEGPTKDYATLYAHLSKVRIKQGSSVRQGDRIGDMGNTGRSTGSHLHFEIRTLNGTVDPLLYLPKVEAPKPNVFGKAWPGTTILPSEAQRVE